MPGSFSLKPCSSANLSYSSRDFVGARRFSGLFFVSFFVTVIVTLQVVFVFIHHSADISFRGMNNSRPWYRALAESLFWNAEWATTQARKGQAISSILSSSQADVICLTEGYLELPPSDRHRVRESTATPA